jgi:hypothetical protein
MYSRIREIDICTERKFLHTELEEGKKEILNWKTLHLSFLLDRVLIHTNKNVRWAGFKDCKGEAVHEDNQSRSSIKTAWT